MEADFDVIDDSADETIVGDETVGVVLEEAELVDCDDIKLENDDVRYHLYAVNRDDNSVEYKVMHVSNNDREGNELSIATPMNNTVQVLTTPLNAQLYVLSNGNEIITPDSARTVVPNVTKLQIDGSQNILSAKKKRTDRRRVVHNEVERRRRDRISSWIAKLAKLLVDCELDSEQNVRQEGDAKPNLEAQSKGGILERAFEYIMELKEGPVKLAQSLNESTYLTEEVKNLRQVVNQLRDENSQLKIQISKQENAIIESAILDS